MGPSIGRRALLLAMASTPAFARAAVTAGPDPAPASLSAAARRSVRYFGAAVRPELLEQDSSLRQLVVRDCDHLTPEIHLKWDALEPAKGQYAYGPADSLLAFAQAHGLRVRGHTLLWDRSTPEWAKRELLEQRRWRLVAEHFARTMGRYGDRIGEWDVVNEPVDTEGGDAGLRLNTFHRAFGRGYVRDALIQAREIAPGARLLINDYGFEYANPVDRARREAFLRLLGELKASGAPLDGVGLQAHLDLGKGPLDARGLSAFFARLADLGLDVTVTEMDVKEDDYASSLGVRDGRVADEARRYLEIALSQPAVRGVVTWGLSDRHSWLSEGDGAGNPAPPGAAPPPLNRGLPYDDRYAPKPMYWAIRDALIGSSRAGFAYRAPRAGRVA